MKNNEMKSVWQIVWMLLMMPLATAWGQEAFGADEMQRIYDEVKTPYKYGMVVAPDDDHHQIDCPTVYRENSKWYMTYVCYNGKGGTDGRGYETWLASSDDLLKWTTLGRVLSYKAEGWDMNQRGGFPALIDWDWDGTYAMQKYRRRHWMTYIGGHGTGYEAVREPLNIGLASTRGDITTAHEWDGSDAPLLSIHDADAQWWEQLVQYKSTVYLDRQKRFGSRFVMFYNAGGVNPANQLKAERIGIALSDDMRRWKRLPLTVDGGTQGNPVFANEVQGIITGDAQIVRMGDKYVMFYFSAYDPSRPYNAFNTFAVSRDLLHWQRWQGADLVFPSKPYDDMFAHKSYVVKHDSVVYHFYCAVNKAGQRGIAVATSVPMGRSAVAFPTPLATGRRTLETFADGWRARVVEANQPLVYGDSLWQEVSVPHNFDDYYGYRQLKHGNLHGTAVYERDFKAQKQEGKRYFLQFEGIGTYATVTLNGHTFPREGVGRTVYTLDVTDHLAADNHLSVRVEHPELISDMPWVCGGCSSEWGFSEGSQPFGIYRPVTLVTTDEVRVEPFGVHVWNNVACDSVFIDTEVKNYGTSAANIELVNKMNQASGKTFFRLPVSVRLEAGETRTIRQTAAVADVHRWNPDDPYLYNLVTMVKRDGKTTDETSTEFGIRNISWPVHRKDTTDGRFYINGKPFFINGTCDYEHLFGGSHAWSHEQVAARVKEMRQAGFNAFREAHQPHNLYYQQLLDEQGMPFWSQFSAHIWYDTPAFRENFKRHLVQWVKERRNSPSVVLWGLQNESVLPKDFAEECTALIRQLDPTACDQRAVTTCNGGEGTDWNVVQNWSGTYGGDPEKYGSELSRRDQLLNGEYGAWRTLGLHYDSETRPAKKDYSEESFVNLLRTKAKLASAAADSVCGHFQWIFVSHENPGRVQPDEALRRIDKVGPFNYKGILTPWEQPTEAFHMYRKLYVGDDSDTATPTAADAHPVSLRGADGYRYLYRVNCGGDALTDSFGETWAQDDSIHSQSWSAAFGLNPFMASQGHITLPIHGTDDDQLFQYFRWGRHRLKYRFVVPPGSYRVELYFVEPWLGARYGTKIDCEGERMFDVAINGQRVLHDFDPWAEGGYAGALKRTFDIDAPDGEILISFPNTKAGEAVIAAIAIAEEESDVLMAQTVLAPTLPDDYWESLDADTVARYPQSLLPSDREAFPVVRYQPQSGARWTITPGVAREYALHFRMKNTTGKAVTGRLTVTDSKGTTLVDRPLTIPTTPNKMKVLNTTTGTQINAGTYRVAVNGAKGVEWGELEVQ